jgi:CheY-like chemotaxis protein
MYIYCADDNPLQLRRAKELVEVACKEKKFNNVEIVECRDGAELLQAVQKNVPAMILLDINMPVLDGLSALARIRSDDKKIKIIMVSSEDSKVIRRFKSGERSEIDDAKKVELLKKVVDRVKKGNKEEGKINSILEACGNLGLDPIQVAMDLGADEFIQKPYESGVAGKVLAKYMTASMRLS